MAELVSETGFLQVHSATASWGRLRRTCRGRRSAGERLQSDGLVKHNWSKNFEQWKKTGTDRPYHYLGSAIWYTRIGHAAGESMLDLMKKK